MMITKLELWQNSTTFCVILDTIQNKHNEVARLITLQLKQTN